jgi:hypothetical protein
MADPLATYLNDHLAGAELGIDITRALGQRHNGQPLGDFAVALTAQIEQDRDTLRSIAAKVGKGSSSLKEGAAWLTERLSRMKLTSANDLGTFEALEMLVLGIHGKLALWRVLAALAAFDKTLRTVDYSELIARAHYQEAQVEQRRLETAHAVFQRSPDSKARHN